MKRTTLLLVLSLAVVGFITAQVDVSSSDINPKQSTALSTTKSNTNLATAGLYKDDFDYDVNPTDYVKLNNSFFSLLFGSGSNGAPGNEGDTIGEWGIKSDSLFTGFYFDGNNLSNQTANGTTQYSVTTNNYDNFGNYDGEGVVNTIKRNWTDGSNDLFITTIGLDGMGALTFGGGFKYNVLNGDIAPTAISNGAISNPASVSLATLGSATSTYTMATGGGTIINKTYDASGNELQENGSVYDQDTYNTSIYGGGLFYGNNWTAANNFKFKAYIGGNFNYFNNVGQGGLTSYSQNFSASMPALGGYSNASYYDYLKSNTAASYLQLTPILMANVDIPVGKDTFTTQIWYQLDAPIFSNSYNDQNGASQTGGVATYSSETTVTINSVAPPSGSYDTKTTITNGYTNDNINLLTHWIKLNIQYKKSVSDTIAVGINFKPVLELSNETQTISSQSLSTVTYSNNNLTADPSNDYVQKTTIVSPTTSLTNYNYTLSSKINLATQVTLVPDVFILNASATITPPGLSLTGTTQSTQTQGYQTIVKTMGNGQNTTNSTTPLAQTYTTSAAYTDQQVYQNALSSSNIQFNLGVNYFFTQNIMVDLSFQTNVFGGGTQNGVIGNAANTNTLDLANVNLGLIVRY